MLRNKIRLAVSVLALCGAAAFTAEAWGTVYNITAQVPAGVGQFGTIHNDQYDSSGLVSNFQQSGNTISFSTTDAAIMNNLVGSCAIADPSKARYCTVGFPMLVDNKKKATMYVNLVAANQEMILTGAKACPFPAWVEMGNFVQSTDQVNIATFDPALGLTGEVLAAPATVTRVSS